MKAALLTEELDAVLEYPFTRQRYSEYFKVLTSKATDLTNNPRVVKAWDVILPEESEEYAIKEVDPVYNPDLDRWERTYETVPRDPQEVTLTLQEAKKRRFRQTVKIAENLRSGNFVFGAGEYPISKLPELQAAKDHPSLNRVLNIGLGDYQEVSDQQVSNLYNAISDFIDATYQNEKIIVDQIKSGTTLAEIKAIDVNSGWPSNT